MALTNPTPPPTLAFKPRPRSKCPPRAVSSGKASMSLEDPEASQGRPQPTRVGIEFTHLQPLLVEKPAWPKSSATTRTRPMELITDAQSRRAADSDSSELNRFEFCRKSHPALAAMSRSRETKVRHQRARAHAQVRLTTENRHPCPWGKVMIGESARENPFSSRNSESFS